MRLCQDELFDRFRMNLYLLLCHRSHVLEGHSHVDLQVGQQGHDFRIGGGMQELKVQLKVL